MPAHSGTGSVNQYSTAQHVLQGGDVAFTIVVNRGPGDDDADDRSQPDQEDHGDANCTEVEFMQEAVQEAITEAVQDAVQEVCYEPMCIEMQPDTPKQDAGFFAGSYQLALRHLAVSLTACLPKLLIFELCMPRMKLNATSECSCYESNHHLHYCLTAAIVIVAQRESLHA